MPLKLMYITNDPNVATIAQNSGVDRIFVDMEYIGKDRRQGGMDSVKNHHTIRDVENVRGALQTAELLVRVNPIHDAVAGCPSNKDEINAAILAGADVLMLPYYKTVRDAEQFLATVDGRARTMLLVETAAAVQCLDDTLRLPGIDEVYIGLNDLSISCGYRFMFEPLANGLVESMCYKIRKAELPYGFGGIAALGKGAVPAQTIIKEHYRLGSTMAILSRSFCNTQACASLDEVQETFRTGVRDIRMLEQECQLHADYFWSNQHALCSAVHAVLEKTA